MADARAAAAGTDVRHNGADVAAILAAAFAMLLLGAIQTMSELDEGFKETLFDIGKAWMPGAEGIGPYSGKETVMLAGWIAAWTGLHFALRGRTVDTRLWFAVALAMVLLGTLGVWPPVWHALGA